MENFKKLSLTIQIFISVLVVVKAALVLEPDLEWDPCNIDFMEKEKGFKIIEDYKYIPPSCELVNKTSTKWCEYFSCLSTLPISKEVIGYVRIRTKRSLAVNPRLHGECLMKYPRLPAHVRVLDLSSDKRENITSSLFEDVTDLKFIRSLLLKEIVSIADDVVGNLSSLECLNLDSYNVDEGSDVLRKLLSIPTLRRLSARRSPVIVELITTLTIQSNLRSLWLSGNGFSKAPGNFSAILSSTFPGLKGLALDGSSFTQTLRSRTLESLDLSDSSRHSIPELCHLKTQLLPELLRLDMSNNQLTHLWYVNFNCTPKLSYLDLSRNQFSLFNADMFSVVLTKISVVHLEYQNVAYLSLSSAQIYVYGRGIVSFEDVPDTEYRLTLWSVRTLHLDNCNQLRFRGDLSTDKQWLFFKHTPYLQELYLNGSNLRLIEEQTFLQVFGHLHDLRTLSLSNTKLQFVSAETFSGSVFPNMTELILSDNAITRIPDGCFDSLTQLVHLDLSGNKITTVSSLTFSSSLHGRLQAFDLSQNPLTCSCDLMWFRNWFLSDHIKLFKSSAHEYKCHNFPRKILLSDFIVNEQSCLLSRETNSMIIFCCSVLITTFTIFTLLFRYRWHLRLVLYEAFRGRDDVRRRRLEQGNFDHDVFVSYASEDLKWVRRHLMPQLEDHLHLRLCIHDRQFIPGKNIVDNIADCVEKSKKILMVFTKNFLRSQWCQFELAFCLSHVMEHEDALIILCVDDVVSCEMTSTMMAVLRTTTYIQWENQADAVRSFWGRLKLALNEVIPDDEHAV